MLFSRLSVFLVVVSLVFCVDALCTSHELCMKDINKTSEHYTGIVIDYWQKRLALDDKITQKLKRSVGKLNEEISRGPTACTEHLLPIKDIQKYSTDVQKACFSNTYDPTLPKEVADYFSGNYKGPMGKLCEIYVKHMNDNCDYLANGIKMIEGCDVEAVFNGLYRRTWLDCVKSVGVK